MDSTLDLATRVGHTKAKGLPWPLQNPPVAASPMPSLKSPDPRNGSIAVS
jgi:hypothetical protein